MTTDYERRSRLKNQARTREFAGLNSTQQGVLVGLAKGPALVHNMTAQYLVRRGYARPTDPHWDVKRPTNVVLEITEDGLDLARGRV